MERLNDIAIALTGVIGFVRQYVPPERLPNAAMAGAITAGAGFLLAFWGAKLLRVVFVLGFVLTGAMIGVQVARGQNVDTLIGLLLGAGVAGLLGHFLYRWWVGLAVGTIAVMLVAVLSAPEIDMELRSFQDQHLGVGTGDFVNVLPQAETAPNGGLLPEGLRAFRDHMLQQRREVVNRLGAVAGLAFLVGMGLGLLLPRLTTVVGTSVVGVGGLLAGAGTLLSVYRPTAWANIAAHPGWLVAAAGLVWVTALSVQSRGRRRPAPSDHDSEAEPAAG